MPSAIMLPQSEGLAQQTRIRQRRSVPLSFWISRAEAEFLQGELEHRTTKARYRRTSRKEFVKQLTHIERCQSCIRRIRECNEIPDLADDEPELISSPEAHHSMGKSQNNPWNISLFLQRNAGDPAIKVRNFLGESS
jgi:hypothetical protein